MILWILLAAIGGLAVAVLLLPFFRTTKILPTREAQEAAILRDRIGEIQREREQGILSAAEADAAKAELSRGLISLTRYGQETEEQPTENRSLKGAPKGAYLAAVAALPFAALITYGLIGSPGQAGQPFAERATSPDEATQHAGSDMEASMNKLAQRLEENPGDLDGWILLARSRAAIGQLQQSAEAFRQAVQLAPENVELRGNYGEALVSAVGGIVTPEAKKQFQWVNAKLPGDHRSRYYLGLAEAQAGNGQAALELWLALEADAAPGTGWLPALQERMRQVSAQFDIDLASLAPDRAQVIPTPGPTAEQIATAQEMPEDEQSSMIRGMVARLAERLEEEPDDIEGWLRLARSYRVLGESDKARQAINQARENAKAINSESLALVDAAAREFGIPLED